jgi:glycosyltransferase involved in cell wall biosynthesis
VLRSLLADYPTERLEVVTSESVLDSLRERPDRGGLLPVPHLGVAPLRSRRRGLRRALRALNVIKVAHATRGILRRLRGDSVLVAHPWGGELGSELFVAAYLASRIGGRPLVVYELDEWRASVTTSGGTARLLERMFHARIARGASTLWVMSEPLALAMAERYGVEAGVLPHSVDLARFGPRRLRDRPVRDLALVYTGAVYGAQADALARVCRAAARSALPCRLVVYTADDRAALSALGVAGPRVEVREPVSPEEIPAVLALADALVLPLSFELSVRSVVETSLPTKTADYLASGIPILVHAPEYAAVSRLARAEGWGLVVAGASETALVHAIGSLARDGPLCLQLVARARAVAEQRYDARKRRAEFRESLLRASRQAEAERVA